MESLGPLLVLDDDAISALPNKVSILSMCILLSSLNSDAAHDVIFAFPHFIKSVLFI